MENDTSNQAWDYPIRSDLSGQSQSTDPIFWRPWPCSACSEEPTPIDYLCRCQEASGDDPAGEWNEFVDRFRPLESARLKEWAYSCTHTEECIIDTQELARGSEHIVFLDESKANVIKVTLPNFFGDLYYIDEGRPVQAECTPFLYFVRMDNWRTLFGNAPSPVGITRNGQIVTVQKFIEGGPASVEQVRDYLINAGLQPVNEKWFLWKRINDDGTETWVGDARDENFVNSNGVIMPIDLRIWWMKPDLQ